jgi:two-component system sensor histidine kinase/response regulator
VATILIVDDEPMNRDLIIALLAESGHTLIEGRNGEEALALVQRTAVDLVLLDVMMPGLDGLEVTRRLRQRPAVEYLPIVLVTALNDQASKVDGLNAGADEFLTKPIDGRELLVRTGNLLRLRERELALQRQNAELMELHRFRDELSSLLVHDLKNPMAAVIGNLALMKSDGRLDQQQRETIDDATRASERVVRLLQNLLDVARQEAGRLELRRSTVAVYDLLAEVVEQRQSAARMMRMEILFQGDPELRLDADADILTRAAENILDNAIRHTPTGGKIRVHTKAGPGSSVQLRFGNTGTAVPPEARHLIFDKFGRVAEGMGRMNLGLGLYFCRLAAEAHGGRIWVEEAPPFATEFVIELPGAQKER